MIQAFTLLHFNIIRCQGNAGGIKWVAGIHLGRRIDLGFLKIGFYFEMMYIVGIINKASQEKSPSTRRGQPQTNLLTGQVKHRLLLHLVAQLCAAVQVRQPRRRIAFQREAHRSDGGTASRQARGEPRRRGDQRRNEPERVRTQHIKHMLTWLAFAEGEARPADGGTDIRGSEGAVLIKT